MANLQKLLLGKLFLSCCKRLMFKLKSSNRGQPGHAIWNNIRWKKARGQTSTWVCREESGVGDGQHVVSSESFLSHRKLPIQAVTCSGGRTGAGFCARWRSLKLQRILLTKKRDENDVQKVWVRYFGVLHHQQGRYERRSCRWYTILA